MESEALVVKLFEAFSVEYDTVDELMKAVFGETLEAMRDVTDNGVELESDEILEAFIIISVVVGELE